MLENRFELIWSGCKIKKAIAASAVRFVDFVEAFGQALVTGLVAEFALVIKNRLRKRVPDLVAPEVVVDFLPAREADNCHGGRQVAVGREVIQRRHEFAVREITRGAEDHNRARLRHCARGNSFAKRVWFRLVSGSIHNRNKLLVSSNANRQKIRKRELLRKPRDCGTNEWLVCHSPSSPVRLLDSAAALPALQIVPCAKFYYETARSMRVQCLRL